MDNAYCKKNDIVYDIATFSNLEMVKIDSLRHSIYCNECKAQGYYRKKSINGIPACFGAYHEDDCSYKSKESSPRYDAVTIEEVNTIQTNQSTIDVNFNTYTKGQLESKPSTPSGKPVSSSGTTSRHTKAPTQTRNASRGLRSLLRMLMKTDTFAKSEILINAFGKNPYKAKNFFVNFNEITKEHVNKWRGYWGVISKSDSEISWLNTSNENDVSIPVTNLTEYIKNTFKIDSCDDLQGAMILVFGKLLVSKSDNEKWYIKITYDNPSHIFIKLAK